jgi:hypothetical protein
VRAFAHTFGILALNGGFGVWWLSPPTPALAGNACRSTAAPSWTLKAKKPDPRAGEHFPTALACARQKKAFWRAMDNSRNRFTSTTANQPIRAVKAASNSERSFFFFFFCASRCFFYFGFWDLFSGFAALTEPFQQPARVLRLDYTRFACEWSVKVEPAF